MTGNLDTVIALKEQEIEQAREQVIVGYQRITEQQGYIARLLCCGRPVDEAERKLATWQQAQEVNEQHVKLCESGLAELHNNLRLTVIVKAGPRPEPTDRTHARLVRRRATT